MPRTSYSAVYSKWLGDRIRGARLAVGLTQNELARRLEVSGPYIAAVEAGRENLTIGQLAAIAEALKVVLDITLTVPAREYETLNSASQGRALAASPKTA
jgi:transcriptional regulator with XRE-family HTH domain